ncbi:MAG: hypothetical protein H6718_22310 [Polyangiaceae bacterium]|nr:hypothetical protein [Myxococcales bacterium]MCB9588158.1 hypothetical protein [Polyangiaceae bacterium]
MGLAVGVGGLLYVSERKQREACEARVALLGARAPEWRNPSGAGICAGESRPQALVLLEVLEQYPTLPKLRVRVEPQLVGKSAQVELDSSSILAPPGDAALRDPAVWLHEVAHLQSAGKRPSEPIAQRVLRAIEEGAADYYAASLTGNGTLGVIEGRAQRDLSQSVEPQLTEWSALALGAADPHRFGWALASQLWKRLGANPMLAADLLRGLAALEPGETRGAYVIQRLSQAIPRRSRAPLATCLSAWLPPELRPQPHLENTN